MVRLNITGGRAHNLDSNLYSRISNSNLELLSYYNIYLIYNLIIVIYIATILKKCIKRFFIYNSIQC